MHRATTAKSHCRLHQPQVDEAALVCGQRHATTRRRRRAAISACGIPTVDVGAAGRFNSQGRHIVALILAES
ncbi:MAG: hypothetical protein QOG10_5073 [Kribbellaceae bacterium]|nr:hypothetical protein [Kribbellaceae bacterium]